MATRVNIYNIVQIYSTQAAFTALDKYGYVYAWGDVGYGGFDDINLLNLSNIVQIYSTSRGSFAALDTSGYVYAWGQTWSGGFGGINVTKQVTLSGESYLSDIVQIYSTDAAFAALDKQGLVYAWGAEWAGGFNSNNDIAKTQATKVSLNDSNDPLHDASAIENIVQIYSTNQAFAALDKDGYIYVWGDPSFAGIDRTVATLVTISGEDGINDISNIKLIYNTGSAFAALSTSDDVYAWGDYNNGGHTSTTVATQLNNKFKMLNNDFINYNINIQ